MTCGQTENELWFKYRYGRITSSLFSKVCHFRGKSHDNYITREILNDNSNALNTNAIMCDFVFYTDMGFISDRIYYDECFFNDIVNKCSSFFDKHVHPALLAKI